MTAPAAVHWRSAGLGDAHSLSEAGKLTQHLGTITIDLEPFSCPSEMNLLAVKENIIVSHVQT